MINEGAFVRLVFAWMQVFSLSVASAQQTRIANVEQVSMLQLIASPEKFDGKVIQVVGFLRLEFEGNMLYAHQEDYEHRIFKNALWVVRNSRIDQNAQKLDQRYVIIIGTFDASHKGHESLASGTITNITAADPWPIPPKRR